MFVVLNHTKGSEFFFTRTVGYVQIGTGVRTKRAAGFDTVATCTNCMEFAVAVVAVVGGLDSTEHWALLALAHGPEHTHYGLPPASPS